MRYPRDVVGISPRTSKKEYIVEYAVWKFSMLDSLALKYPEFCDAHQLMKMKSARRVRFPVDSGNHSRRLTKIMELI